MRFRERNDIVTLKTTYKDENLPPAGTPALTETDFFVAKSGTSNQTWDIVTPNFRKRMAAGEIIVNAYENRKVTRLTTGDGVITRANTAWPNGTFQKSTRIGPQLQKILGGAIMDGATETLQSYYRLTNDQVAQAKALAATKAFNEVSRGEAELLVMLGELRKTVQLLKNPLGNLKSLLDKAHLDKMRDKRPWVRLLTLTDYISDAWLKYRYGFKPVIYDLQGVVEAIEADREKMRHIARGTEYRQATTFSTHVQSHGDLDTNWQETVLDEYHVKCGLIYQAKMQPNDSFGFNLRSLLGAAWELTPFSFVVDWFLNVGPFLGALHPFFFVETGGQFTVETRTITIVRSVIGTDHVRNVSSSTLLRQMSGTEVYIDKRKVRTPGIAFPSLQHKIDMSRFDFRDVRVRDTLALIQKQLKDR